MAFGRVRLIANNNSNVGVVLDVRKAETQPEEQSLEKSSAER